MPGPGSGVLATGRIVSVNSVSCASAGNCAAGGGYFDDNLGNLGFVAVERLGPFAPPRLGRSPLAPSPAWVQRCLTAPGAGCLQAAVGQTAIGGAENHQQLVVRQPGQTKVPAMFARSTRTLFVTALALASLGLTGAGSAGSPPAAYATAHPVTVYVAGAASSARRTSSPPPSPTASSTPSPPHRRYGCQPRLDGTVELPREAPEPLIPAGREQRALESPTRRAATRACDCALGGTDIPVMRRPCLCFFGGDRGRPQSPGIHGSSNAPSAAASRSARRCRPTAHRSNRSTDFVATVSTAPIMSPCRRR